MMPYPKYGGDPLLNLLSYLDDANVEVRLTLTGELEIKLPSGNTVPIELLDEIRLQYKDLHNYMLETEVAIARNRTSQNHQA